MEANAAIQIEQLSTGRKLDDDQDSDQSKDEGVNQSSSQSQQNQQVEVLLQMIKSTAYVWAYFTISAKILSYVKLGNLKFIWNTYEYIKK